MIRRGSGRELHGCFENKHWVRDSCIATKFVDQVSDKVGAPRYKDIRGKSGNIETLCSLIILLRICLEDTPSRGASMNFTLLFIPGKIFVSFSRSILSPGRRITPNSWQTLTNSCGLCQVGRFSNESPPMI